MSIPNNEKQPCRDCVNCVTQLDFSTCDLTSSQEYDPITGKKSFGKSCTEIRGTNECAFRRVEESDKKEELDEQKSTCENMIDKKNQRVTCEDIIRKEIDNVKTKSFYFYCVFMFFCLISIIFILANSFLWGFLNNMIFIMFPITLACFSSIFFAHFLTNKFDKFYYDKKINPLLEKVRREDQNMLL